MAQNTVDVCSITGLETSGPAEVRHLAFRKAGSFSKSSTVHWSLPTKRRRLTDRQVSRNVVLSVLHLVFCSPARRDISASYLAKRFAACKRAFKGVPLTPATYMRVNSVIAKFYCLTRPMPANVPSEIIEYVCASIQFVKEAGVQRKLPLKQNTACLTFGLLQLFTQGFAPMGVTSIYKVPYVIHHGLSPSQFAKLPGLRARQQTIAVRQIQRVCVDAIGKPAIQLPQFISHAPPLEGGDKT
jgi:hypothetical protein